MDQRNHWIGWFGLVCLLLGQAADAAEFRYAQSIPAEQIGWLKRDRETFAKFRFSPKEWELQQLLGVNRLSPQNLNAWLEARIQAVVGEDFDWAKDITPIQTKFSYPKPGLLPFVEEAPSTRTTPVRKGITIMSNVGVAVYATGKRADELRAVRIKGDRWITVTSPRAGVIKIGPGLFSGRRLVDSQNLLATANSISRIGTFFHEARHSDGNGAHLGFYHAICPDGHDLQGSNSCDRNINGPYMIGGYILRAMTEACDTCTRGQIETLRAIYLSSFGRVLARNLDGTPTREWDPTPEGQR